MGISVVWNVLSVIVTLILVMVLLFLLAWSVKYMKTLTYKIGLIMRAAKIKEENPDLVVAEEEPRGHGNGEAIEEDGPSVDEVQQIMNQMVAQGRSTKFLTVLLMVLDKYNHILVWPCIKFQKNREYDLLKPPYRFYNLLNIIGVFILWQVIVFVSAVSFTTGDGLEGINIALYLLLLVLCAFIASPLTMLVIYAFYKIYIANVKAAFTQNIVTDRYRDLNVSESSIDLDSKHAETEKRLLDDEEMEGGDSERPISKEVGFKDIERRQRLKNHTRANDTTQNDGSIASSRALLHQEGDSTQINNLKSESDKSFDFEIDSDDAFLGEYGDVDMINAQAKANNNVKTFITFMALLILILLSSSTCIYVLWKMSGANAFRCIVMLVVGWLLFDVAIARTFYSFIIALVLWCKQQHKHRKMKRMLEQILLQKQLERLQKNEGLYHPQAVKKVRRKKKIERIDSFTDSDGIHHDHISEHWVEEEVEKDQFNNTIY